MQNKAEKEKTLACYHQKGKREELKGKGKSGTNPLPAPGMQQAR